MAFSVEARPPFLDHRLVEFCFSLPFWEKIRAGWTKHLLRRALAEELPASVRKRRVKVAFPGPVARWLTTEPTLRSVRELLLDPVCLGRGIVNRRRLERRIGSRRPWSRPYARLRAARLWRLITLELWFRGFID